MHSLTVLAPLLSFFALVQAQADPCVGQVGTSTNRKVAIVVDSSGSNDWNDPTNLRVAAGQSIVANLGGTDQVAVVDFDGSATVISPLGPASAASFVGIDSSGDTCISCGVEEALVTLQGAAPNTAGIIVLTDGEDSFVSALIEQIEIATGLGIRVSFGFLNPSGGVQDPDILSAIDANGGVYANIADATAQANFVSLVLASGLVNADTTGTGGSTFLFQGLKVSGNVSASTSPQTYQYDALANEVLQINVTAITSGIQFDSSLKKDGNEVGKASTDATTGESTVEYTVGSTAESLTLEVSTTDTTGGLFSIALGSSVNRTINVCGQVPDDKKPQPNVTIIPTGKVTPTNTVLPTFTGAATMLQGVIAAAAFPILFALAL